MNRSPVWGKALQRLSDNESFLARASRFDFDLLSKELAEGLSRREALRRLGGGMAGAMLAFLGLQSKAWGAFPCEITILRDLAQGGVATFRVVYQGKLKEDKVKGPATSSQIASFLAWTAEKAGLSGSLQGNVVSFDDGCNSLVSVEYFNSGSGSPAAGCSCMGFKPCQITILRDLAAGGAGAINIVYQGKTKTDRFKGFMTQGAVADRLGIIASQVGMTSQVFGSTVDLADGGNSVITIEYFNSGSGQVASMTCSEGGGGGKVFCDGGQRCGTFSGNCSSSTEPMWSSCKPVCRYDNGIVGPAICASGSLLPGTGVSCASSADCTNGTVCTVGYCGPIQGQPCTNDVDCNDGRGNPWACIEGACYGLLCSAICP